MEGTPTGLRNPYIAIMNNPDSDEKDYGTPMLIGKAISAKISPKINTSNLVADDGISETASTLGEVDVEVQVDKLISDTQASMFGYKKDSNGVLISNSDDMPPYVAFGFKALTSKNVFKYVWLYKGRFEPVEENFQTQGDKVDFQTPTAKATFLRRNCDNNWKASVVEGDPGVPQNVIDNWFKAVYEQNSNLSALTVAVTPVDKATNVLSTADIKFTFNKAIKANTVSAMNAFLMKADGTTVNVTASLSSDGKVITLHPTSTLTTGVYIAVCTTGIKDIFNLSLLTNSVTTFTV